MYRRFAQEPILLSSTIGRNKRELIVTNMTSVTIIAVITSIAAITIITSISTIITIITIISSMHSISIASGSPLETFPVVVRHWSHAVNLDVITSMLYIIMRFPCGKR